MSEIAYGKREIFHNEREISLGKRTISRNEHEVIYE